MDEVLKWIAIIIGIIAGLALLWVLFVFLSALFDDYGILLGIIIVGALIVAIRSWAVS